MYNALLVTLVLSSCSDDVEAFRSSVFPGSWWHTELKLISSMVLQEIMGVLIGSAVAPIAMCLGWKKTNKYGAMAGAVLGQWLGLISWVVFAKVRSHHDLSC